jgi:hypothetical protein
MTFADGRNVCAGVVVAEEPASYGGALPEGTQARRARGARSRRRGRGREVTGDF